MRWTTLGIAVLLVGCGARTDGLDPFGAAGAAGASAAGGVAGSGATGGVWATGGAGSGGIAGTGGVILDAAMPDAADPCPDGGTPGDAGCHCGALSFTIDTQQSCSLGLQPGADLDGEGFISLGGQQHRVFALDRWGKGHIIAWCDATTLPELLMAFDVTGYLGGVAQPRVASFGDNYLCKPGALSSHPLPKTIAYQGEDLPAKYQGNSAALAQDFDVVIFCGFRQGWPNPWITELGEFVAIHGKGLLAVMDYEGIVTAQDFANMSAITKPSGIVFNPLNLAWAPSSINVALECVPDLPLPPPE